MELKKYRQPIITKFFIIKPCTGRSCKTLHCRTHLKCAQTDVWQSVKGRENISVFSEANYPDDEHFPTLWFSSFQGFLFRCFSLNSDEWSRGRKKGEERVPPGYSRLGAGCAHWKYSEQGGRQDMCGGCGRLTSGEKMCGMLGNQRLGP